MPVAVNMKRKPSFFKVLIGDFSKQLRVPPAFLKYIKGNLVGNCILRSPTGKFWCVNSEKNVNGTCFRRGWREFVKDHSLEVGDFLVFKYYGKSMFSVKIYDKTNCEKDIGPAKMNNDNPSFCTEIGNQNQVRDEIEDSSPLIFKAGSERKLITSVQDYCKRGSEREKPHDKKDDDAEGSKWEAWPAKISLAADGCMSLSNWWLDVSTPALKVYFRKRDEKGRESTHQGTTVVGKEKLEIFPIGNAT